MDVWILLRKTTAVLFIILTISGNLWLTMKIVGGDTSSFELVAGVTLGLLGFCGCLYLLKSFLGLGDSNDRPSNSD